MGAPGAESSARVVCVFVCEFPRQSRPPCIFGVSVTSAEHLWAAFAVFCAIVVFHGEV